MAKSTQGKVVTIMNMKGGVGKTTISIHMGTMLVGKEINQNYKRVLVIDYDPQFNLSQSLLSVESYKEALDNNKTILSVLQDSNTELNICELQQPLSIHPPDIRELITSVISNGKWKLDIIPSTLDLMPLAISSSSTAIDIMSKRFINMIEQAKSQYDLILIDCHPSGSLFTKTAVTSSEHIIIPVTPSPYSERGIALMRDFIKDLFIGKKSPDLHIILNNMKSSATDRAFANKLTIISDKYVKYTLKCQISHSKVYSEVIYGSGFLHLSRSRTFKKEFESVVEELITRIEG